MGRIKIIFVALLSLAGITAVCSRLSFSQTNTIPFRVVVIAEANLDLSDLDLRDAENRPVTSSILKRATQNLFLQSANDIFLGNLSFAKKQMYALLAKTLDLISGFLCSARDGVMPLIQVLFEKKKEAGLSLFVRVALFVNIIFLVALFTDFQPTTHRLLVVKTTCLRR